MLAFVTHGWAQDKKGAAKAVADGKQVSLEYTLTLEDKTQVDTNVGKNRPLVFTQGAHEIIPGLEKQIAGLKVGETKRIEVPPEEGYGPIQPERKQEIDKSKLPAEAQKVGAMLEGRSPDGQTMFARVTEIKDKTVMLDLNHPLAGKKLIFDIKVLNVEEGAKKVEVPAAAPAASAAKPKK
ncbi:MAG: FKBP-type peptidyl-prolyl cis-trans isomerase [Candidatus Binatia bacterium]